MLLLFRMLKAGAKIAYARGSLLLVRQHREGQISASDELAARRLREQCILSERVLEELGDLRTRYAGPLRSWRARRAFNLGRAVAADPSITAEFGPVSARDRLAGYLWQFRRRVAAALSARMDGHRVPRMFETAPIAEDHRAGIRAMGYEPRRAA
jgi:hypothetical protein